MAAERVLTVVVYEAEPDEGGFWCEVPELPGCVAQGDDLDELKLCTAYRTPDGRTVDELPTDSELFRRVEPVLETVPGWNASTREARSWNDLPE